jgi:hypothetical protein
MTSIPVFVDKATWGRSAERIMRDKVKDITGDDEWVRRDAHYDLGKIPEKGVVGKVLHHEFEMGARYVHISDVLEKAMPRVNYALGQVNEAPGKRGHNLVARAEVRAMRESSPAVAALAGKAYEVARNVIIANRNQPKMTDGAEVAATLAEAAQRLSVDGQFGSEGGDDLRAFHAPANIENFSMAAMREAMGIGPNDEGDDQLHMYTFQDFIMSTEETWPEYAEDVEKLAQLFEGNLENIQVFVRGEEYSSRFGCEQPLYIVGVAKDGSVAGLESSVVWT